MYNDKAVIGCELDCRTILIRAYKEVDERVWGVNSRFLGLFVFWGACSKDENHYRNTTINNAICIMKSML